jgi:threonine dehydratase
MGIVCRRDLLALWQAFRIAAEPAASVGIAALLAGAYKPAPGERVAVVISGANMSPCRCVSATTRCGRS